MKDVRNILVVDDEPAILYSIKNGLTNFIIHTTQEPETALELVKENVFDILIVDYKMPGMNGLDLLAHIKKLDIRYMGILLTAYADKDVLEESINQGLVYKIVEKPLDLTHLEEVINETLEQCRKYNHEEEEKKNLLLENEELKRTLDLSHEIIGLQKGLKNIYQQVQLIAGYDVNVLLLGESGTGKEVIADLIHSLGSRRRANYIKINCAAIPEQLAESELFGYTKGAFTGAHTGKKGKIEAAHGGTLFLDEIGELKPELQVKLLRVLQSGKTMEKVGSIAPMVIDFRLISATNTDIEEALTAKKFRSDLYHRINTITLTIPPLRERKEDIPDFIRFFITRHCTKKQLPLKSVEEKALQALLYYSWPGNVRELENTIERAVILSGNSPEIALPHLSLAETGNSPLNYETALHTIGQMVMKKTKELKDIENDLLDYILDIFHGNIYLAARSTGISKDRFYRNRREKLNKFPES